MRLGAVGVLLVGATLIQALPQSEVRAQAVVGQLLDMGAGTPIVVGRITLLDADRQPVVVTMTDTDGRFLLLAPEPGQYWIKAESPFHDDHSDGPILLAGKDTVDLVFGLKPRPVELGEVVVEGERRSFRLAWEGVYDRREAGIGWHIDQHRIRARSGRPVSELIALLPGVGLASDPISGGQEPVFRRPQMQRLISPQSPVCYPQVYLNGVVLAMGGPVPGGLGRFFAIDLEAIEVYPSASGLPGRFSGAFARCGTIVLWTQ